MDELKAKNISIYSILTSIFATLLAGAITWIVASSMHCREIQAILKNDIENIHRQLEHMEKELIRNDERIRELEKK